MTDKPETVADVLAEMRNSGWPYADNWADRIERAMAASAVPVAWSCTQFIEDANGLAIGIDEPRIVWDSDRPDDDGDWEPLFGRSLHAPAVPVESLGRDAPDPVPLNAVRAALEAVDTGRTQIARDNLRILEIHLRAQSAPPPASVPEWTDEQCVQFACVAFRHAPKNLPKGVTLQDIRMGAYRVMNSTAPEESP